MRTDARWFGAQPSTKPGSPIAEIRRWPGDTVVAIYVLAASRDGDRDPPPIAEGRFERHRELDAEWIDWRGSVQTTAGSRAALWLERAVGEALPRVGALIVPGDAGLGPAAMTGLTQESMAVLSRLQIRERLWSKLDPVPPGTPLVVPELGGVPGEKSEDQDPWQVAAGRGGTVGLPPGVEASRLGIGVPVSRELPGGELWLRGRYRDSDGNLVVLGDEQRFGYLARVKPMTKAWKSAKSPPLGAPGAKVQAVEKFDLAAERSGAGRASAERWSEPGFAGEWMVFRLEFDEHGYEVGLPVLRGWRSPSLYWIAATFREAGAPPAPPPVDPAERFGIRFAALRRSERQANPWVEGELSVPGLRAQVSRGWFPVAALRSSDGFPIRFVDRFGTTRGVLSRIESSQRIAELATEPGMAEEEKPARHRALRVYRDGSRRFLFLASEERGFLFEPRLADPRVPASDEQRQRLEQLWRLLIESVQLDRPDEGSG